MKKIVFIFLMQFIYFFSMSQSDIVTNVGDTLFFNKNWKKSVKEKAQFYRITTLVQDNYLVKDFYLNGQVQMESYATSYDPLIQDGPCSYYYKNGQKQGSGNFINDKQTGIWIYWNEKGKIMKKTDYSPPEIKTYDSTSWKPQNQSSIFLVNLNYRYKVNNGFLSSGHGFGMEIGLNLGYFISQRWLLGVFGGLGTRDILYNTKFKSGFLKDLNASSSVTNLNGNDSLVAFSTLQNMNSKNSYFHDRTIYGGIVIRLPYKFAPIVKLYKGYSSYECKVSASLRLQPYNEKDQGYDHDCYELVRKMDWGVEVFLYNGRSRVREYDSEGLIHRKNKNFRWNRNLLGFSFYVEKYDWRSSTLSFSGNQSLTLPMNQLVSEQFLHKYRKEYSIGFRLSMGIF